jgi:flavodoxin
MKTLVVYYSRAGNNAVFAKELAKKMTADIEEIIATNPYSGGFGVFRGAMGSLLGIQGSIEKTRYDPSKYELTVLCTPAWAGHVPAPTRTYLSKNKFNEMAVVSLSFSGANPAAMDGIGKIIGKKPVEAVQIKIAKEGMNPNDLMKSSITPKDLKEKKYQDAMKKIAEIKLRR